MEKVARVLKIDPSDIYYIIGFSALMGVIPVFLPDPLIHILGLTFIFIVMAVSWDMISGLVGEINLGHTVFVGIGGYVTGLLFAPERLEGTIFYGVASMLNPPIPISILIAGFIASISGLLIGLITLRLKGWYFALVTAILPLLFIKSTYIFKDVFGGEEGFSIGLENALAPTTIGRYYYSLIFMVASLTIMYGISKSRLGLTLVAVREDNVLSESLGINIYKYKVLTMVISSFFAGLSGAMIVHYRVTVSPDLYDIPLMLLIILAVVIGGIGSIIGPVIGGFIIYLLKYWILKVYVVPYLPLSIPLNDDIILYSLLIIIAIFAPEGIYIRLRRIYYSI